jgi:uncharacterized protein (TIGR04168 family)
MEPEPFRIAVIGDIHLYYNDWDTKFFNQSNYDLLLFVGDLGVLTNPKLCLPIAERLSGLEKPSLMIPGNHDVHNSFQIIAEGLQNRLLARISGFSHVRFHHQLKAVLEPVILGGYSVHPICRGITRFDVIAARPYGMGGSSLSYRPLQKKLFRVRDIEESSQRLCRLVDEAESGNIIFLAHNGPYGISDSPVDIWGCDFDPSRGDFGDRDLTAAIQHAGNSGKNILAVIAGHMHLQTFLGPKPKTKRRGDPGPLRPWHVKKDGILYINAARVPRIYKEGEEEIHHHLSLVLSDHQVEVKEKLIQSEYLEVE